MVAFLAKPIESEGFEQIIDFLNANPIKYALTINPTVYTLCIKQFWATAKAKDLKFRDEGGVDCLSNKVILEQLTLMGVKTTTWNEFSSTMASAIICLATNQKFNFSKYIFESMVKHLDTGNKFLMYPRFMQVFLDKQVDGMSKHNAIYLIPSHTKKVFGNMKRVGKDFSGKETPLFLTMLVQAQADKNSTMPSAPQHILIIQPITSKHQKKQKPRKPRRQDPEETQPSSPITNIADEALNEENVPTKSNDPPLSRVNTLGSREDSLKLKELMEIYTKMQQRVIDLENTKTVQAKKISSLKKKAKRLEKKRRSRTHGLKRLYKIGLSARVKSSAKEQSLGEDDASKQERNIADIDAYAKITLVNETTEDQERINDEEMFDTYVFNDEEMFAESVVVTEQAKEIVADKDLINDIALAKAFMKIKSTKPKADKVVVQEQELDTATPTTAVTATGTRPKENSNVMQKPSETPTTTTIPLSLKVHDKRKAQLIEDENLAWDNVQAMIDTYYELAVRLQEEEKGDLTIEEKLRLFVELMDKRKKHFAKLRAEKQRRNPLTKAQKRNQISKRAGDKLDQERSKKQKVEDDKESEELKRCLEIILDGNSQMYLTFSKMLKNFDKEDLKVLWRLVKYRFVKTKPVDDMDSFLLHTLKTMFEHQVEDIVWKNQQGLTKVKN
uniref:Xylulose kinase-1 n=1 Tax=Tanacetum cinerariifolium TaxID=118510 RepID=A0A699J310_TANCI|nr:hypothetical protein [Tanacetum cinerariifolium]